MADKFAALIKQLRGTEGLGSGNYEEFARSESPPTPLDHEVLLVYPVLVIVFLWCTYAVLARQV